MRDPLAVLSAPNPPAAACDLGPAGIRVVAEATGGVGYWQRPLGHDRLVDMRAKYRALDGLIEYADGGPDSQRLRACASAWPGCLREAELVAPSRIRLRGQAVERCLAEGEFGPLEQAWPPGPLLPAILADDLHRLLRAQLQPRKAGLSRISIETVVGQAPNAFPWPDTRVWRHFAGTRLRPRAAYLWLAAWSGLGMVALHYCLFERRGRWEHRDDDPGWVRGRSGGRPS